MQGNYSPLKAIIDPSGVQSGMPGETLELHAVVMNQGTQSAIIDVFLDEAYQLFARSPVTPRERVALGAGQSTEVSFKLEIPVDMLPGTYDYTLVIDAPEHYPQDTPIPYSRQIRVLVKEQTIVREHDPTFSLQPTSNPANHLVIQPHQPLQLAIAVNNRSRRVDSFRLSCPDLEDSWFTIRYPNAGVEGMGAFAQSARLELNPATVGQILLTLHPPEDAFAGNYALTLRLHSENAPSLVLLDLAYIQIPYVHRLDLTLRTLLGKVKRSSGKYELKLANLGNTPRQLSFSAKTPAEEQLCAYRFDPISVTVSPYKSAVVDLLVTPLHWWRRPILGSGMAIDFQVDIEDRDNLPLTTSSLSGMLLWQSRPWWQFLLLVLIILGSIGGLGLIAWQIFHPQSVKLVKLELQNRQIDEGDRGLLNWKIDEYNQIQKLRITTTGPSSQKNEYSIAELIERSDGKEPLCVTEDRALICDNFKTEAKLPGEYTFELKMFDRNNNEIDTKTTVKLTIVPKPEPEIISLTMSAAGKLKYATGETILINWTLKNLQKLAGVEILGKSKDGANPFALKIPKSKLSQDPNCKQEQEKQQIVCTNFPLKIAQPGKYQLQIEPTSKSEAKPEKSPAIVPAIEFEVLPKSLKILTFTINGTAEPSRIVKAGEMLKIDWQVDGDEKMNVELIPGGTVARSGSQQLQAIESISQISLVATDNYGHKETKVFSIKVESVSTPSDGNPAPSNTAAPSTPPAGGSGSGGKNPVPSPSNSPGRLLDP
jgi:hypothetical protein